MQPASLVLVVDDHVDAREMLAEYVELVGFRVVTAENGQVAIEHALALMPAVILMDLAMPVMDGLTAIARLKADAATRDIPIFAVSGQGLRR